MRITLLLVFLSTVNCLVQMASTGLKLQKYENVGYIQSKLK